MPALWDFLCLFNPQPVLQKLLDFSTYVSAVGLCPFPTMTSHQLRLHLAAWNDFGMWIAWSGILRILNVNYICLFWVWLLPSGWQLQSKIFMAFSLFKATKGPRSDKLGTSQHHFAPCKGTMKSLNPYNCFVEVRWKKEKWISGSSTWGNQLVLSISNHLQNAKYVLSKVLCFSRCLFQQFCFQALCF